MSFKIPKDSFFYSKYSLSTEPDLTLTIKVNNGRELTRQVTKHAFSRYSKFFEKLHYNNQTTFTLDFDEDVVRSSIDLLSYVSNMIPSHFIDYLPGQVGYEEETKLAIQSFVTNNIVDILRCLGYLLVNDTLIEYLYLNYSYDPETFDIDSFVQLDFIDLHHLWGYWSIYGRPDGARPSVDPDPGPLSLPFIPFCRSMETYDNHEVVALKVIKCDSGKYTVNRERNDGLHISTELHGNGGLTVIIVNKEKGIDYFMSVIVVLTHFKICPRVVGKFYYMVGDEQKWDYNATEEEERQYASNGRGICLMDTRIKKYSDVGHDIKDYIVMIKKVNYEDYKDEFKWYSSPP